MYEKILVPLDGSELAEVALPYAEEIASRLKTEVILFQIVPRAYHFYAAGEGGAQILYTDEEMKPLKASAEDYLKKVASRLEGKGINTRTEVRVGVAADEIIKLSIKDSGGVTGFVVSTMVFDHSVWVENVASDLITPTSFNSLAF